MDKNAFQARLKALDINKQEFAELSNTPYSTVTNWGVLREGKPMPIPNWVEPFLLYYERARQMEYVMREICQKIETVKTAQ